MQFIRNEEINHKVHNETSGGYEMVPVFHVSNVK